MVGEIQVLYFLFLLESRSSYALGIAQPLRYEFESEGYVDLLNRGVARGGAGGARAPPPGIWQIS